MKGESKKSMKSGIFVVRLLQSRVLTIIFFSSFTMRVCDGEDRCYMVPSLNYNEDSSVFSYKLLLNIR